MSSVSSVVKEAVARDFARLFDPERCAVTGCDRRPAKGSRFCGCHKADRAEKRVTVWNGGELLPARAELSKEAARGNTRDRSLTL